MLLKQKVMSGLAWSAGGKFLAQLVTWGVTIVVIRLLSPSDYGLMSLAGVFVSFLAMLSELGLGSAIVQRRDVDNDILRSLFAIVLLVSVAFYLILTVSAPYIAAFYDEPRLVNLIRVLAFVFFLLSFTVLPQSLLLRNMEFRKLAVVDFFSMISGSIVTLIMALMGYGVWSLVWGTLVIRFVSMVGLNWAQPFFFWPRISTKGLWTYFAFGSYVTLSRILWYFWSRTDILIIGKMLGKDLLGFYSIGFYLASLPMEKISGIINQVAFPAFSQIQSEPGTSGKHFLKAVRVMSFVAFPVLWGISSLAPEIVAVFLGPKWIDAALPLQIIALIIPIRMISTMNTPAALGSGRSDVAFYHSLVPLILMPGAFFVGSSWGILGVSLAWVIVFPLVFFINLYLVVSVLNIRIIDVLKAMQLPFLAGLVMYVIVMFVKRMPAMDIQVAPKILILISCGICIYFLMTLIFNRGGLQEIRELVRV